MLRKALLIHAVLVLLASAGVATAEPPTTQPTAALQKPGAGDSAPGEDAPELELYKEMPVVVAAGRREQTQQQAAAEVSVVTAQDIELFGYRSLADVLGGQRSFYIHSDGLNEFAGVRGFLRPGEWNARILVLVDDRPTRENIYGQTHLDQDFVVPLEAVKQIEVVRGPGSALYGTNAVFGVINVVTKSGADVDGVQTKIEGGTQDTGRASVLFGTKTHDDWDILAVVSGYTSQGDNDIIYDGIHDPGLNFGHIQNSDYEGAQAAFVKVKKGEFTGELDFENRLKDNRAATYDASWFNPGTMHEQRANATIRFDHEIADGQSLHAMAYYGSYHYLQQYNIDDAGTIPRYNYVTLGNNDWLGQEIHYDWQINPKLHLLAGAEATQSLYTFQKDYDSIDGQLLSTTPTYNSFGVFVEAEYKMTSWFTLILGGRLDKVQRFGLNSSPRAAAILTPTQNDTIKAMYGRAFRSPNLYEQFYTVPGNEGNPALRPEICDTYELAWERKIGQGYRATLDGYLWRMGDAMDNITLPDGDVQTQNVGTIWAKGLEAELDKQWDNGASMRVYGSVSNAERSSDQLTHSPQWIAGASVAFPIFKRTFLAIEPQFVGSQKSDLGTSTSPTFLTNIVLTSRDIVKNLDLQIGVYNLFSNSARQPHDSAAIQVQPTLNFPDTQFLASLTYRF